MQVRDRAGPIEISIADDEAKSLVWRVRLLDVDNDSMLVEQPSTLRRKVPIEPGTPLIGALAIGQNRWMFHTRVSGLETKVIAGRTVDVLRLDPPLTMERCQRRSFFRISTASLQLPSVGCWSLNDPAAAVPIEVATRAAILEGTGVDPDSIMDLNALAMPKVGIGADAVLLNLGGGGACLRLPHDEAAVLDRPGAFLLRVDLTPSVPLPLPITARLAHTKVDSSQNVHAGFAFDFSLHREYEAFIAEQVCRYVAGLQQPRPGTSQAA